MQEVVQLLGDLYCVNVVPCFVPLLFSLTCRDFYQLLKETCYAKLEKEILRPEKNILLPDCYRQFLKQRELLKEKEIPYKEFVFDSEGVIGSIYCNKDFSLYLCDWIYCSRKDSFDAGFHSLKSIVNDNFGSMGTTTLPCIGVVALYYVQQRVPAPIVIALIKKITNNIEMQFGTEAKNKWLLSFVRNPTQSRETYLRSDAYTPELKFWRWLRDTFAISSPLKERRSSCLGLPRTSW